jgi:mannitol-1-phosphate/altronate dehydrogenase
MINVPLLTREPPNLKVKILAIGAGGLQRALTHEWVHDLIKAGKYGGGIFVGQPRHTSTAEALNQQGGLYHVVTFNKDGVNEIKLIESVVGASTLSTPEGKEKFLSWVKDKLDLILVGVTEAGVRKGQIGMDVLDETLFGYFGQHGSDSTISVMDTDNLRDNGKVLRDIQLEYAKERGIDAYLSWLEREVDFLDEMGDRVVPNPGAVPEAIKEETRRKIGKEDRLATYTESMPGQWSLVISDPRRRLRVPFSELTHRGVVVTAGSIDSYHDWKLRLLNSVHVPFISHLAQLSGYERINDAALDPLIRPYLLKVVEGNARVVEKDIPIESESAVRYALSFVERISSLEDDAARININHTLKLRERISGTIISPHYAAASEYFKDKLAFAIATVFRYLTAVNQEKDAWVGRTDGGETYQFTDPTPTIPTLLIGTIGKSKEWVEKKVRQIFYDYSLWTPPASKQKINLSGNPDCMERVANFYHRMVNGEKALDIIRRL